MFFHRAKTPVDKGEVVSIAVGRSQKEEITANVLSVGRKSIRASLPEVAVAIDVAFVRRQLHAIAPVLGAYLKQSAALREGDQREAAVAIELERLLRPRWMSDLLSIGGLERIAVEGSGFRLRLLSVGEAISDVVVSKTTVELKRRRSALLRVGSVDISLAGHPFLELEQMDEQLDGLVVAVNAKKKSRLDVSCSVGLVSVEPRVFYLFQLIE